MLVLRFLIISVLVGKLARLPVGCSTGNSTQQETTDVGVYTSMSASIFSSTELIKTL